VLSDRFRVDSSGAFVAYGFVRDVTTTPAARPSFPRRAPARASSGTPAGGAAVRPRRRHQWDDANMNDFTFAGGDDVKVSGVGSIGYGEDITVTSQAGAASATT
jgi:hypothetical protein